MPPIISSVDNARRLLWCLSVCKMSPCEVQVTCSQLICAFPQHIPHHSQEVAFPSFPELLLLDFYRASCSNLRFFSQNKPYPSTLNFWKSSLGGLGGFFGVFLKVFSRIMFREKLLSVWLIVLINVRENCSSAQWQHCTSSLCTLKEIGSLRWGLIGSKNQFLLPWNLFPHLSNKMGAWWCFGEAGIPGWSQK